MVSKITDKILPQIKEWQNRLLEPIHPFIFMDAIHYKVRDSGQIVNRAAYVIIGVNIEGTKMSWGYGQVRMVFPVMQLLRRYSI
jgi:transposase-like protein